jgi:hypothetical protein
MKDETGNKERLCPLSSHFRQLLFVVAWHPTCRQIIRTGAKSLKLGKDLDELRTLLLPWYLQVKFVHLFMVSMWSFSTAVAYRNYILPSFLAWERNPSDEAAIATRDKAMERFDNGVILEHIAFPIALLTGLTLVWLAGWDWQSVNWLSVKLGIIVLIFLPIELLDYHLSHFKGNKRKIRLSGDLQHYEDTIRFHWKFFRVSTPLIVVFIPLLFYLAVTKPL